jgi:hypothetical protein
LRVLLIFVDGVGVGVDDTTVNPFTVAVLPTFTELSGGRLTIDSVSRHAERASVVSLDAMLGVEGIPQSGTGQASLLTGANAAALHGSHFGPWVPSRLRALVRDGSVLARALEGGLRVAFANAYPEEVSQLIDGAPATLPSDVPASPAKVARRRRGSSFLRAGPPLAAIGAGLLTRHTSELERGDAVASEITNDAWRDRLGRTGVPVIDAGQAGRNLARIAGQHDLTLFAHYATDYAGHRQDMAGAVAALERFDAFLGGLIAEADDDLLIFIASDHGNIEDVRTGHTRNPALGMVIGNGHEKIARRLRSLTDVTPVILDVLSSSRNDEPPVDV